MERGEGEIVTEIEIQEGKVRRGLNARFEQHSNAPCKRGCEVQVPTTCKKKHYCMIFLLLV